MKRSIITLIVAVLFTACGGTTTLPTTTPEPTAAPTDPPPPTETTAPTATSDPDAVNPTITSSSDDRSDDEQPTDEADDGPALTITSPEDGATLDISNPITIEGTGRALFENNVVVQIRDMDGNVLIEEPTIMDAPLGGEGTWSIELAPNQPIQAEIRAVHFSARDGSVAAEDTVTVTFVLP